ncbi:MAG: ATP cone domain-containing protein, partial [bacterium]|nr:ATP cone domain-containing protein [bacterium]
MVDSDTNFLFPEETMAELTLPKIMFRRIQKRDGTLVDFDKQKITDAIFAAAQSVGGKDYALADSVADRVILYLAQTYADGLLNVEQVQDAIEKMLIENGHARTVKSFILYRAERTRLRQHKLTRPKGIPASAGMTSFPRRRESEPKDLQVRTSDEEIIAWNRQRIIDALIRETQLDAGTAAQISKEVEAQIIDAKIRVITAGLIRELVNAKLIEYGFEKEQRLHTRLGIPLYDFEQLLLSNKSELEDSVEQTVTAAISRQYAFAKVFSQDISDAHIQGDIYLHRLDKITKVYQLRIEAPEDLAQLKTLLTHNLTSSYQIRLNGNNLADLIANNLDSSLLNNRFEWTVVLSESSLTDEKVNQILALAEQTSLRLGLARNPILEPSELVMHKV